MYTTFTLMCTAFTCPVFQNHGVLTVATMLGRFRSALYNAIGNTDEEGGLQPNSPAHHQLRPKYPYQRPLFVKLDTADEIQVKPRCVCFASRSKADNRTSNKFSSRILKLRDNFKDISINSRDRRAHI